MDWLNLNVRVLDSPEFLGSEPVERSAWLCLMRYCIGQENGGRIIDAALWGDRKWQQLVRITLKEVNRACDLWHWVGDDLIINFYPIEKEDEVRNKRVAGRATAEKRWGRVDSSANSSAINSATCSAHAEGKGRGKEGEGEGEAAPATPSPKSVLARGLRRNGMRAGPAEVEEWADLLNGSAQVASVEEGVSAMTWIVKTMRKRGEVIEYARQGAVLALEWAKRAAASREGVT